MCLGKAIKRVMDQHGLNPQTLAGAIDPPVRGITVLRWLDGEVNKIPYTAIRCFADVHNMSICEYLKALGEKPHAKPKKN